MMTFDGKVFSWNGNLYKSDIVMSAVRPYVHAIGKAVPKHIRQTLMQDGTRKIEVNPEPYISFLLKEPNPYMTMQKFQEWMATMVKINNHAFAVIARDEAGLPVGMYPINACMAKEKYDKAGNLSIQFWLPDGREDTFAYEDLIHIYGDCSGGDFWGGSKVEMLLPLMEQIGTIDKGIVSAIKNGSVIRWLLKFSNSLRPEDLKKNAQEFANQFLDTNNGFGVAATDSKSEAKQITPTDYVPNAEQIGTLIKRFYSAINTNEKIVTSSYSEDEWNAYYESECEPDIIQLGDQYTTKLFSRKKRSYGNSIVLEASNLATASMQTKLSLKEMVDRGAMLPNEWRAILNLAPIPGGDKPIRRLDTAEVITEEVKNE